MDIKVNERTVICFDLDDTLYNEIDFLKSGFRSIARSVEPDWKTLLSRMFSIYRSGGDAFRYIEETYKLSVTEQLEIYRNHLPDIKAFTGVKSLFEEILCRMGRIGIITDGRSVTQRNKLKALGLIEFPDLILISEETGYEKPHAYNFERILDNYPGHEYCYIGDNLLKDFLVPNKLGWTTIGVLDNGKNIHNHAYTLIDKPGYKPAYFVERITEIKVY